MAMILPLGGDGGNNNKHAFNLKLLVSMMPLEVEWHTVRHLKALIHGI